MAKISEVAQLGPLVTPCAVSQQLGEGSIPAGCRIAWARRMLRKGCLVARHGWRCDAEPRRLYLVLTAVNETETLETQFEARSERAKFARLSWADVDANDWYVVNQLELVR
jgi:hypothetical protein